MTVVSPRVFKDELLIYTEDTRVEDDVMDALQNDVMLCFLTVVLHEEENAKVEKPGQQAGAEVAIQDKLQKEYDVIVVRASTNVDSRGEFVGDAVEGSVASPMPKVGVLSPSKRI
ncbi:hypothetical protein ACFX2I_003493 [Malus domestica]